MGLLTLNPPHRGGDAQRAEGVYKPVLNTRITAELNPA